MKYLWPSLLATHKTGKHTTQVPAKGTGGPAELVCIGLWLICAQTLGSTVAETSFGDSAVPGRGFTTLNGLHKS